MGTQLYKSNTKTPPRLFKNNILNALFSEVHLTVPLVLYLPLVAFFTYRSIWTMNTPALSFFGLFFLGFFVWTFFEYSLHRWMLHWIPDNRWGKRMNFWVHGIHHDYPHAARVVPPGRTLPGLALVGVFLHFTLGPVYWYAVFSGFVLGYLCYEMVHYASHNMKWKNKWFVKLQRHHMHHHYRNSDSSFGFTGTF